MSKSSSNLHSNWVYRINHSSVEHSDVVYSDDPFSEFESDEDSNIKSQNKPNKSFEIVKRSKSEINSKIKIFKKKPLEKNCNVQMPFANSDNMTYKTYRHMMNSAVLNFLNTGN